MPSGCIAMSKGPSGADQVPISAAGMDECRSGQHEQKISRSLAEMKRKLVVVGAGMASGRILEHLLKASQDAYDVTLFGAEPRGNYDRIMLSPVLAGDASYNEIVTHDSAWYAERGIACR